MNYVTLCRATSGIALMSLFLSAPAHASITQEDLMEAHTLVQEFQKLPSSILSCNSEDPNERRGEQTFADKNSRLVRTLNPIYLRFFSHEFYRLFMWVQCAVPAHPPLIADGGLTNKGIFNNNYYYDFRFGIAQEPGAEDGLASIEVRPARPLPANKIGVKVQFNYGEDKLWNNYTLIFEDDTWKIDDMAPKSVETDSEVIHWGSNSLKRELQLVYHYSEKQHQIRLRREK